MGAERLVFSLHSFSKTLISFCEGYTWVNTQADSVHQICVCARVCVHIAASPFLHFLVGTELYYGQCYYKLLNLGINGGC